MDASFNHVRHSRRAMQAEIGTDMEGSLQNQLQRTRHSLNSVAARPLEQIVFRNWLASDVILIRTTLLIGWLAEGEIIASGFA